MGEVNISPSTLVELLRRGLNVGIPPTALANLFDLDPEVVKTLSITVRRETYGLSLIHISRHLSSEPPSLLATVTRTHPRCHSTYSVTR